MIINSGINPIYEALVYFSRRMNGLSCEKVYNDMARTWQLHAQEIKEMMRPLFELEGELNKLSTGAHERMDFFFTQLSIDKDCGNFATRASMLLFVLSNGTFEGLEALRFVCHNQNRDVLRHNILVAALAEGTDYNKDGMDHATFFSKLYESALSPVAKLAALDVCENYDAYCDELLDLIAPYVARIEECSYIYKDIVNELITTFKNSETPEAIFLNSFGMDTRAFDTVSMHPCLFRCFSASIVSISDEESVLASMVGVLLLRVLAFKPESLSTNEMLEILKLLSDRSRFEMLEILGRERSYGQKIANEFGLTTATVYHHLNKLQMAGLVVVELDGARPFYRIDGDKLRLFIKNLTHRLLGE